MFDSKYIITSLISLLLVAAWQKPSLYKEHLSNKVVFISVLITCMFFVWEVAISEVGELITEDLAGTAKDKIIDAIKAKSAPTLWVVFSFLMIFGGILLDWVADISEKHEKEKLKNE